MRGKRAQPSPAPFWSRITPAHAGKTGRCTHAQRRNRDHPRACGENARCMDSWSRMTGSPPRMRGKPLLADFLTDLFGITPAHAGKTCSRLPHFGSPRDHPRACGENVSIHSQNFLHSGSPPRMRGKLKPAVADEVSGRITPAHAGKTETLIIQCLWKWDHPRACGENCINSYLALLGKGSPPRMRGKQIFVKGSQILTGITPAHAGKTTRWRLSSFSYGDHPRACGENTAEQIRARRHRGSPPRMRGKRKDGSGGLKKWGITPAHAGKTLTMTIAACSPRDHPRACGENPLSFAILLEQRGSPPRMRGKHFGKGVFPWLILVLSLDPL